MPQNAFVLQRNRKIGEKVVLNLKKRFFDAYYVDTKEEALHKAIELIPHTDVISWGGSMSILEIGLVDHLLKNEYNVINRDLAANKEEKMALLKQAMTCNTYLMSTNAVTEDGQLVNIDGTGNRVSALIFGPDSVVVIAGVNKVVQTVDEAVKRARELAAPINMQRVAGTGLRQTPCFSTGSCCDCVSKDSICSNIVITRLCSVSKRIKVIVVGENLGF